MLQVGGKWERGGRAGLVRQRGPSWRVQQVTTGTSSRQKRSSIPSAP